MSARIVSEKYNAILKTSHDLFWKFGIRRVSIEEICREAGVSKMTFYRFFPNKTELAIKVADELFDNMLKDYRELMDRDIPFEEKIKQQLLMKFEGTHDITTELVKDIYGNPDNPIFKYWKLKTDEMLKLVMDDYRHAQEKGWIRKDVKLEFILYMINKSSEIAADPQLQAMYPNMQSLIMEIANMLFFGIMPKN